MARITDSNRPGAQLAKALASISEGQVSEPLRQYVLRRDHRVCSYCGGFANQVDHRDPVSRGGLSIAANLTACCGDCNRRKGARTLDEWQRDEDRKRLLAAAAAVASRGAHVSPAPPPLRLAVKKRPRRVRRIQL
jgi:5-methylcytosine-specific restriction endonuclease McrA